MRLDHPIFHRPLEAQIATRAIPTPAGYATWESGLPRTFDAWTVQSGELGKTVDYGLVSDPYGFEDTPDAEWISSGVNSKGPRSMALGRQGNWFLWGFAGDPGQMTPSARAVFLNTLVWMKQFDGRTPLIPTLAAGDTARCPGREQARVHVAMVRGLKSDARMAAYVRNQFPVAVWERTKGDADALATWTDENFEWLHAVVSKVEYEDELPDGRKTKQYYDMSVLDADPILAELGVSNRKPEFFEEYERLLGERGADDATVKDLAARYLPKDAPSEPGAFESWLAARKGRLFFSDVYGYRWFVAPEAARSSQ